MNERVAMSEMSWRTYAGKIAAGAPILLPVGSLEQHGYHMPLSVDTLIPQALAIAAARRLGAVVAPPIAYGYKSQPKSGGGQGFVGTTSLDGATLTALVRDILREFARHGCRRIAVIAGHFENTMFIIEGIDLALRDLSAAGIGDFHVIRVDYWEFISPQTFATVFGDDFPGWALEHASVMETSMMLHLHPDLVDVSQAAHDGPARFAAWDSYPAPAGYLPPSGVLSTVKGATAEKGALLFADYAAGVTATIAEAFGLTP